MTPLAMSLLMLQGAAAADSKMILGIAEVGKTTIAEAQKNIQNAGCQFNADDNSLYVAQGCFDLPGNPKIRLVINHNTQTIDVFMLEYQKSFNGEFFQQYYSALKRQYGEANTRRLPFVGDRLAVWKKPKIYIELNEPHLSFNAYLIYMTPEWKKSIDSYEAGQKKKKKNELERL
jgi:hypothetical protein